MAYKASQNLAPRIQRLSPLPLSQYIPCVSYIKYSPASQVCCPVLFASSFYISCSLSLENSLLSSLSLDIMPSQKTS